MQENTDEENVTNVSLQKYASYLDTLVRSMPKNLPRLFIIWPERHMHPLARPKLAKIAEQRGFTVLDLYETFGNHAETLSWDTVHPSSKTAAQAADIILQTLEKNVLPSLQ